MLFGGLEFPDFVWQAALRGDLVIFAGSGVSMGEPSSLPNFAGLCLDISRDLRAELQRREGEHDDAYLGRLVEANVPVHARAADRLRRAAPGITELHRSIASLFPGPNSVRIVTTNFDNLLEDACEKRWSGKDIPVFSAPALPLGSDFEGVVHIHGRLGDRNDRMVLTDRDFSRAYLTEGWARRFMQALVERHVVLFVGFSFNDVPSRYLLRGVPPGAFEKLASLVSVSEAANVPSGIARVVFDPREDFIELRSGVRELAEFTSRDADQHRHRLLGLLDEPPPIPGSSADYLAWGFGDDVQCQYLCSDARTSSADWLDWCNERHLLDVLFDEHATLEGSSRLRGWWFSGLALRDTTWKRAIELLATRMGRMSEDLRHCLWSKLGERLRESEENLNLQERFWLALLGGIVPSSRTSSARQRSISAFPAANSREFARVWATVLEPHLSLEPSTFPLDAEGDQPAVRVELAFEVEPFVAVGAWEKRNPRSAELASAMLPVLRLQLEGAYALLLLSGRAKDRWDPANFSRSEILGRAHDLGLERHPMTAIINASRDSLEKLAESDPRRGVGVFEDWIRSDSFLIRRLALTMLQKLLPIMGPHEIAHRLIDEDWRTIPSAKPEVFALLKILFPLLGAESRASFLASMRPTLLTELEEPDLGKRVDLNETSEYEWFNLLCWLQLNTPGDERLEAEIAEVQRSRPYFEMREHPDLDYWVGEGGSVRPETPVELSELHGLDSTALMELAEEVRSRPSGGPLVDRYRGLLESVGRLAVEDLRWGMQAATNLHADLRVGKDLLDALLAAWSNSDLRIEASTELLHWLARNNLPVEVEDESTRLFEKILQRSCDELGLSDREEALSTAWRMWNGASAYSPHSPREDWLHIAINHAQGRIALAVLRLASAWRKHKTDQENAYPPELERLLTAMCNPEEPGRGLGRVILASQVHVLFSVDEAWTRKNLIPRFLWEGDPEVAGQVWDAFLVWGRLYPRLFEALEPALQGAVEHLEGRDGKRRRLVEHLAYISLAPELQSREWIAAVLQGLSARDRGAWFSTLGRGLQELGDTRSEEVWAQWLRNSIRARLQLGFPKVEAEELAGLYLLALSLPTSLVADGLSLVGRRPVPAALSFGILHRIEERVTELLPDDVLDLLLCLLEERPDHLYIDDGVISSLRTKLQGATDEEKKQRLRALLAAAGRADLSDRLLGFGQGVKNEAE